VRLRCYCDADEPVEIAIGKGRRRWADAYAAIPDDTGRCEAIDASGVVLRVHSFAAAASSSSNLSASASGPVTVAATPLELARIVVDATDRGAQRHADAIRTALEPLQVLVGSLLRMVDSYQSRMIALERAYLGQVRATAEAQAEATAVAADAAAASQADPLAQVLPMMLAGMQQQQPNGKGAP